MITKQITIINCYIYFSLFISFLEFLNYLSIRAASSIRLRKGAAICVLWRHHSGQAWPDVTFLSLLPGRRTLLTTDDALGYVTIGTNVTQHPPEKRWVSHSSVIASLQFSLDISDESICCVPCSCGHYCRCLSHSFLYANLKELSLALVSNRWRYNLRHVSGIVV